VADQQLEWLIEPLRDAIENCRCIVLVQAWQKMPYFALLPFQIHLRWPGRIDALSLNPRLGIVPFFESDFFTASAPLYGVQEVISRRTNARVSRGLKRSFPEDFVPQDWESRAAKRLSKLGKLVLPGVSYVAIDRVTPEGDVAPGHRSVLGRIAARAGLRPFVLVPAKGGISTKSASVFAGLDALLVNAQGLRGRRTISSLRTILDCCVGKVPLVVLTSGPTDVLALFEEGLIPSVHLQFVGDMQRSLEIGITIVGRDRPSADREFEFAIEGLEQRGRAIADLVRMAKAAWWALRQALYRPFTQSPEVRRFLAAHDQALGQMPAESAMLTGVRDLLRREMLNRDLEAERVRAVIDATLSVPGGYGTLVLVRDEVEAQKLTVSLAQELGLSPEDMEQLGVHVTGRRGYWPDRPFGAAVTAGYFGTRTIDTLLACRAVHVRFVVDPIEARVAWFQTKRAAELLKSCGAPAAEGVLRVMAKELSGHVAAFGDLVELSLALSKLEQSADPDEAARSQPPPALHARLVFTDGSSIEVNFHARFEVIREAGKRLKTLEASALEPGDQIVVLQEDSRVLFSERLLDALDQGPLARQAEKRVTWLAVVQSVYAARQPTAQAIAQEMRERGHPVDLATVRSWLRIDRTDAAVPDRPDRFMAFASALGIAIEPNELLDLYSGIQNWRVNHRKFGRELARAVRAAYLGRLDATTLRKIENEWGLNARQLVEGARVAVLDEVILPEGGEDAIH